MRKLLVRVTIKDCDVSTFKGSGPGGQHRNKTDSGVRIVHRASGAVGTAVDERHQGQNKKLAWRRMAESKAFQSWVRSLLPQEAVERSTERIRTYNMVDRRVKDHRTGKVSHDVEGILNGDLDLLR